MAASRGFPCYSTVARLSGKLWLRLTSHTAYERRW